jgi:hypothetical protein
VPQDFKAGITEQMSHIAAPAGEKVVGANDIAVAFQQRFTQVRAEKSSAACD